MKTIVRYSFLFLFATLFQSSLRAQSISGPTTVCGGVKYRYTFSGTNCSASKWEVIGATLGTWGGTFADITFPKATTERSFKIFANYTCNTGLGETTLDVVVIGQHDPINRGVVDIPCNFQGVRTFQLPQVPQSDQNVTWSNDAGWPVAGGPRGTGGYIIDYNINNANAGTVTALTYNNGCANYPQNTDRFAVSRSNPLTALTFTAESPASLCTTTPVTVAVNPLSPAPVAYQWYTVPANVLKLNSGSYSSASAPLSTTTPSVTVSAFSSTLNGVSATLYVSATYASGCSTPVATRALNVVNAAPAAPTVTSTLVSGPDEPTEYQFTATAVSNATYNWYVAGTLRETSTSNTFRWYFPCRTSATVYCTVTNQCGTSSQSNSVTRTGGCRDREAASNFMISPNPATGALSISAVQPKVSKTAKLAASAEEIREVRIIGQTGNIIKAERFGVGTYKATLDLTGILPGSYIVHIFNGKQWTAKQVVIVQ